ncbi:AAA family ATPase [Ekhidna sp.]|uniref:AAA family ATPase n=1 Tax=Ekhidna sp. TaxID=2608089 RepID=UPI003C7B1E8F
MEQLALFEKISKDNILQAIERIDEEGYPTNRKSSSYDLIYNRKAYPPKYILSLAGYFADGNFISHKEFQGGESTASFDFLKSHGFEILPKNETGGLEQSKPVKDIHLKYFKDFFLEEEFELLKEYQGQKKEEVDEHHEAYNKLSKAYEKLEFWTKEVDSLTFDYGAWSIRKRPTSQANKFDGYLWSQLYPSKELKEYRKVAITLGLDENYRFVVKIDTVHLGENDPVRKHYEVFRGDYDNSTIVLFKDFSASDNWENLIEFGKESVQKLTSKYYELIESIQELEIDAEDLNIKPANEMENKPNLNAILYGPPGTGKTYNTINRAIAICDPKFDLSQSRDIVKERFDVLQREGQIVFTTFHQSLSYEDFIEGLKPVEKEQMITYPIQDGLFKRICKEAFLSMLSPEELKSSDSDEKTLDSIYDDYLDSLRPEIGTGNPVFHTMYGHEILLMDIKKTSIIVKFKWFNKEKGIEATQPFSVTKDKLFQLYQGGLNPNEITSLKESFKPFFKHNLSVYYAVYKSFHDFIKENLTEETDLEPFDQDRYSYEELIDSWESAILQKDKPFHELLDGAKKFVLIIDEINRGNVSQVFGELITLIEEGKRAGKNEALTVTLPYSKEKFSIPPNLYLLGTMNTADRSVEALDAALRRRFVFEEIHPNPDLLDSYQVMYRFWRQKMGRYYGAVSIYEKHEKDIRELLGLKFKSSQSEVTYTEVGDDLPEDFTFSYYYERVKELIYFEGGFSFRILLEAINARISFLKDEDHQIGHSYFMEVFSIEELKETFKKNIIPLLKEYFYNDYSKIRLVLGDGFMEKIPKVSFPVSSEEINEEDQYRLKTIDENFDVLAAIKQTIGK